jgi:mRNA interferase YafQ
MKVAFSSKFEKKVAKRAKRDNSLYVEIGEVVDLFKRCQKLPPHYRDHALRGEYRGFREFRLRFNLLVIYYDIEKDILLFHDLGTHEELFR